MIGKYQRCLFAIGLVVSVFTVLNLFEAPTSADDKLKTAEQNAS